MIRENIHTNVVIPQEFRDNIDKQIEKKVKDYLERTKSEDRLIGYSYDIKVNIEIKLDEPTNQTKLELK